MTDDLTYVGTLGDPGFRHCGPPGDRLYLVGQCPVCKTALFSTRPEKYSHCGHCSALAEAKEEA